MTGGDCAHDVKLAALPRLSHRGERVLQLWSACHSQRRFHFGGMGGLDYSGVEVVIRRLRLGTTPDEFRLLQVIENAHLQHLSDQARRELEEAEANRRSR